jgi:5-formaminoimidazole-4-carboxamide-1-(beta)-D-ribofuranosyl 5'-monophosphate synthetase
MDARTLLAGYDPDHLTVGALGGHSALDVAHGAKGGGFRTVVVAQQGRERTYERYQVQDEGGEGERGCIDELIVVPKFQDILQKNVQDKLKKLNTIFVHNRYFWVYFDDPARVENEFNIPIFGSRYLLKLEERDGSARLTTGQPYNQYHLLRDAGIRTPKIFEKAADIDRPVIVKASEAARGYERAFFVVSSAAEWEEKGAQLEQAGKVSADWRKATIEEFVVGAPVNFNFFWSPLTSELELLGTDTRRQTNLDGFLRMTAEQQAATAKQVELKMIETGHIAVTVKESLLEKAYDLGERFVQATQKLSKEIDPAQKGIIGPFALQGAVVAEEGQEDIVIFDVSLRIPGSPGVRATPYSGYLYGEPMSVGERCALEIRRAVAEKKLEEIVT